MSDFDEAKGLGAVTVDDGGNYLFHCVEIADGTRAIDVGRPVMFQPLPKFGRYEASRIRPC